MTLKINSTYKTKGGHTVKTANTPGDNKYPFKVIIYNSDGSENRIAYYTYNGIYNLDKSGDFDIVEEL